MQKTIPCLCLLAAWLAAVAVPTTWARDGTSIAPPDLIYVMPDATTARYAMRAFNAVNCTGGTSGHCYPGPDPVGGGALTYAPDPARRRVIVSWTNGGLACSVGERYTVTEIPWALYSGDRFIMMMPESGEARNEQDELEADHLPDPNPWSDERTATFSGAVTSYRIPPSPGRRCP